MTILGWQLNTRSDAAFHFVLGYQIVSFRILVVPFKKALFFLTPAHISGSYGFVVVEFKKWRKLVEIACE
jgi:hypothetical protein